MYECSSFAHLKAIAFEAFNKHIGPGMALGLQYTFMAPVDGRAEKEVVALVNSQSCFDTFLKVWDEFVKPRQIKSQDHILPVLDVVQTLPVAVPESPPRNRAPAGNVPNDSFQLARTVPSAVEVLPPQELASREVPPSVAQQSVSTKAARHKSSAPPAAGPSSLPSSVDDMYASSRKLAASLLASFKKSDLIETPSIRLVMRCGEGSARIPFDHAARPDLETLKRECKEALIARLASSPGEAAELQRRQFVLSASINDCAAEIDLDDQRDLHLLCDAVRNSGNDYSCFLLADLRAEGEEDAPTPLPPSLIVDSVLHLDREVLQVNLCHTPMREKDRKKKPHADEGMVDVRGVIVPPTKEV